MRKVFRGRGVAAKTKVYNCGAGFASRCCFDEISEAGVLPAFFFGAAAYQEGYYVTVEIIEKFVFRVKKSSVACHFGYAACVVRRFRRVC